MGFYEKSYLLLYSCKLRQPTIRGIHLFTHGNQDYTEILIKTYQWKSAFYYSQKCNLTGESWVINVIILLGLSFSPKVITDGLKWIENNSCFMQALWPVAIHHISPSLTAQILSLNHPRVSVTPPMSYRHLKTGFSKKKW